ncbi:hypothetical protein RHMOL_Rhmol09G0151100 [Rhododendron molle]|uniref:Uncharacterized protein n=1 Tax=Rhododendron molle TaxID=49168 RepID=A0ACC0MDK1_RHOML|nr:hypothetical protein RHMOL_Rhmol09G0151100 [Rhododendron molle]
MFLETAALDRPTYSLEETEPPLLHLVSKLAQPGEEAVEERRWAEKVKRLLRLWTSWPNQIPFVQLDISPLWALQFIELPRVPELGSRNASDVFSVLASEFDIRFCVSKECQECRKQRRCTHDIMRFKCKNEEEGSSNLILVLGTGNLPFVSIHYTCSRDPSAMLGHNYMASQQMESCFIVRLFKETSSDHLSKADLEGGSAYFGDSVYSYAELEQTTDDFDPSKELADGGNGTMYHGKLQDGREVAVKRLYEHNYKRVKQFMNEVEILTCLSHPNLVILYGCTSRHSRELLLVYEYIPNGTVADHLHGDRAKEGLLAWPVRMNIAIETASALAYLHDSDVIHRDVKTVNILLDNDFSIKLGDFGLSRLFPTHATHVSTAPQGTPGYVDPEYHQCYQLTDKSDVYSFGVVLVELISSLPAVDINRHRDDINLANLAVNRIKNRLIHELIDPSLGFESDPSVERMTLSVAEVAIRCLQLDKDMRPTMEEILEALMEIQAHNDENAGTELGQGGFGCVFKGKLENDCLVAVKVLKGLKGNGEDFINEVATTSRTSHVNIVTLLGFCFEGHHRALIYEFMPSGSLDKFIHDAGFSTYRQLGWDAMYQIAVGITRGLEYLHRGCKTRIFHFDIKPHNILLDEDFCPKISDFGLAKLCPQKESIISLTDARGTAGYIAPEVFSRNFGGVSHKSDMYSYGMMVLEMVGGRKNISVEVDHTSEIYFPHWVYKRLELDEELGLHDIMDGEANAGARKMIIVGLWCIQTDPSNRPSMSRVVEMLEGRTEPLQIPPSLIYLLPQEYWWIRPLLMS